MNLLKIASLLSLSVCCACATAKSPVPVADSTPAAPSLLQLAIKPAADSAAGGQRVPVQFTLKNSGDQPIHTCLSSGRLVHLWGIDKQFAYTATEEPATRSACEETLDLPAHGESSWNEEMEIPAVAAGKAKIVGFVQVHPEGGRPVWLSATYSPFRIEAGEAMVKPVLDLRTGMRAASAFTASAASAAIHHP